MSDQEDPVIAAATRAVMEEIRACTPGARLAEVPTLFAFGPIYRAITAWSTLCPACQYGRPAELCERHQQQMDDSLRSYRETFRDKELIAAEARAEQAERERDMIGAQRDDALRALEATRR